LNFNIVSKN